MRQALRAGACRLVVVALCLACAPPCAHADAQARPRRLSILLTNDDGYAAPGLAAVGRALRAAGHEVTVVAPRSNQSGQGSALTLSAPGGVSLVRHDAQTWSLAGTPVDCVQVALDVVMKDRPPDLVVSGANFGENVGQAGTLSSGTVGAALDAVLQGIPAIAVSVGIALDERAAGFPSTVDAFEPAAAFVARLVGALAAAKPAGALLEPGWLINVNVPVPYSRVRGVCIVGLERESTLDVVWSATAGASDGERVAVPGLVATRRRHASRAGDTSAFRDGYITLSFITTDLGRRPGEMPRSATRLGRLTP